MFRIIISKNELPVKIVICRKTDDLNGDFVKELEKKFETKRMVLFALPDKNISSAKGKEKPGHLLLEIIPFEKKEIQILATDLGSKNGSWISKELSIHEYKKQLAKMANVVNQTINITDEINRKSDVSYEKVGKEPVKRVLPAIMNIAESRVISIS